MTLVVILTVRRAALDSFRRFEAQAATIMAGHGGRIERVVVVDPDPTAAELKEVHLVGFPAAAAFDAYLQDERLAPLAPMRAEAVVRTEILVGVEGVRHGAATPE